MSDLYAVCTRHMAFARLHVHLSMRRTIADFCCFDMPVALPNGTQPPVSVSLYPYVEQDLCSNQPWLILHKVCTRSRQPSFRKVAVAVPSNLSQTADPVT